MEHRKNKKTIIDKLIIGMLKRTISNFESSGKKVVLIGTRYYTYDTNNCELLGFFDYDEIAGILLDNILIYIDQAIDELNIDLWGKCNFCKKCYHTSELKPLGGLGDICNNCETEIFSDK